MSKRLPPGPSDGFFGVGLLGKIQSDPLGFYQEMARKYGDIVTFRLGPYRDYLLSHPDLIREALVTRARSFIKMPNIPRVLGQLDGNGLALSEGDFWLRQRRLVQPAFHTHRHGSYARVMVESTSRLLESWRQTNTESLDFDREMTSLTLDIATRTFFGAELTAQEKLETGRAVGILSHTFVKELTSLIVLPDWLPLESKRQKKWAIRYLDDMVRGFIRARRASRADVGDLLSMLLLAVDEEGDGKGMTDEQARDEVMTLFMAGHDTTAAGLTWIWYVLARHPDVLERVRQEVDRVLAGRKATFEDVARLPYLEMVVKETLRLYPPAIGTFMRMATQDVEIGGYPLAKGSLVEMYSFVVHRDPRWFADPLCFDPERFAPGRSEQRPQFAYFPFGAGPRMCIGQSFAMMEMMLVVATMLARGQPEWPEGQADAVLLPNLSLRPKGGLTMRWRWR